jgi:hypothetical protein
LDRRRSFGGRKWLDGSFSTADDRNSLIDTFKKSAKDGMVKVLEKNETKGRNRFEPPNCHFC